MGFNSRLSVVLSAFSIMVFLSIIGVLAGPAIPSVSDPIATEPIDLSACSTVVLWCNATITDDDGWEDIDVVNATFWDPAATTEDASDDNSSHYTNYTCSLGTNTTANDVPANCSFTLWYYANPVDWTCKIYANDTSGNVDSNSTTTVTINTLRALDAENTINFGSLAPGATSPSDVNNTVTNCGNAIIDLNLTGTNLTNATASVSNITVTYIKYNLTNANQDYTANMTSLTESDLTRSEFSLAKSMANPSNRTTHWKTSLPSVIEELVYTGTITFTAVEDT